MRASLLAVAALLVVHDGRAADQATAHERAFWVSLRDAIAYEAIETWV